jgi:hypothetical protein
VAVELSRTDYDRLVETGESLTEFMRHSPLAEAEDIEFPGLEVVDPWSTGAA